MLCEILNLCQRLTILLIYRLFHRVHFGIPNLPIYLALSVHFTEIKMFAEPHTELSPNAHDPRQLFRGITQHTHLGVSLEMSLTNPPFLQINVLLA